MSSEEAKPKLDIEAVIEVIEQLIACHDEPTCPAIDIARDMINLLRETASA